MASTTTSTTIQYDSSLGQNVTTTTVEAFDTYPTPPTDAYDVQQSYTGGKYVVTYKEIGTASLGENIEITSSCSTEPLITHPIFASGGTHALSNSDLKAISLAESNPSDTANGWSALVAANPTSPLGWYAQFILWGIDSYLNPTVTSHVSLVESQIVDLSTVGSVYTSYFKSVSLPSLSGQANWLLTGASSKSLNTSKWRNSYELRASGLKGWSSSLYTYSGGGGSNTFGF